MGYQKNRMLKSGYLGALKENYTDENLCTEVMFEHTFVGFIQKMVVFIKKSNKIWFSPPCDN